LRPPGFGANVGAQLHDQTAGSSYLSGGIVSHAIRSSSLRALLALVAVGGLAPLRAQQDTTTTRTFDFGQPLTLVLSGSGQYDRVTSRRTATSFEVSIEPLYSVSLFVDSAAFREAWRKKPNLDAIHKAVREAVFPLAVVLTMPYDITADRLAQELAQDLKDIEGSPALLGYLEEDLTAGDEIVFRVIDGQTVKVTAYGKEWPDIRSRKFARALLGIWIGEGKLSAEAEGLFSRSLAWSR